MNITTNYKLVHTDDDLVLWFKNPELRKTKKNFDILTKVVSKGLSSCLNIAKEQGMITNVKGFHTITLLCAWDDITNDIQIGWQGLPFILNLEDDLFEVMFTAITNIFGITFSVIITGKFPKIKDKKVSKKQFLSQFSN